MKADLSPAVEALTEKIIRAGFAVSNGLGHGFLERVYRNALAEELSLAGLQLEREKPFQVSYKDKPVGLYVADLVVDAKVIVELKATSQLGDANVAQVLNYLQASHLPIGLLMNFGTPRLQWRRVIL